MPKSPEETMIEQLHSSTEGMQLPDPNGPPWLNSLDTINGIVTAWASDLIRRYGEASGNQEAFMAWLDGECLRMNNLFLGFKADEKRDDFQRTIWNMPQNLGTSIGPNMGFDAETHMAVRDAFMMTAASLIEAVNTNEGADPADWGWQMDMHIEALAHGLLGLPVVED